MTEHPAPTTDREPAPRRLVNVCFHGIGTPRRELEPGEAAYWIDPDLYQRILDEVAERRDVRLSFDDGNVSDVEVGLDGLLRRHLTATFFALAGRLGSPGSLGEGEVRHLRDSGMTIGTHGMDHRPWRGMDAISRRRELVEARRRLAEAAGTAIDQAALPLGRYDRRLLAQLRREGYRRVHTSDRRRARPGAWLQPRYSVRATDTLDSIRAEVLTPPGRLNVLEREAVGLVKRLR